MASQKISALSTVATTSGSDLFTLVSGGANYSITFTNLQSSIASALTSAQLPAITLTGPVTGSSSGGTIATTIGSGQVVNSMLANMANNTIKGNTSGITGSPSDLGLGNISESTSSVLTITGGTAAVIGLGVTIQVSRATTSTSGYLSSVDWNTFNNKQSALGFTPVNKAGDTMTGALALPSGSVTATSLNFGTANTGFYGPTSSSLSTVISGTEVGRWAAGGLNINTTSGSGALNLKLLSDSVTAGLNLLNGAHSVGLSIYSNGNTFLYGDSDTHLTFAGSLGGTGPTSPRSKWDVNFSDTNTSIPSISVNFLSISNHSNINNNLSPLVFTNNPGDYTSGIVGVHESHTSGTSSGHLELFTENVGTISTKLKIAADGGLTASKYGAGVATFDSSGNISSTNAEAVFQPSTGVHLYDDFTGSTIAGRLNWALTTSGGGSTSSMQPSTVSSTHPGIARLTAGANAGTASTLALCQTGIVLGGGVMTIEGVFNIGTLSTGTQTYTFRFGLGDVLTADFANGVYFEYDTASSLNWIIKTAAASVRTSTTTSTAVSTGWTKLGIIINAAGSSATFYVNGVSVGSIATNLPTLDTGFAIQLLGVLGNATKSVDIDYFMMNQHLTTAR